VSDPSKGSDSSKGSEPSKKEEPVKGQAADKAPREQRAPDPGPGGLSFTPGSIFLAKAGETQGYLAEDHEIPDRLKFDPMIIVTIAGFIAQMVQALMAACAPKASQAMGWARDPGIRGRIFMRQQARGYLRKHPEVDAWAYQVADAVSLTGQKTSQQEMEGMYAEVKRARGEG
jgi:uncharacterized protein YneF (UPF0154 family)